jgi:hypothetical protein
MSKRYYYTDAIVALYMMKEFEVKYDFENEEGLIRIIKTPKIRRDNFMRKIYVDKQSEHIFEPKKHDLGVNSNCSDSLYFDGVHWFIGMRAFGNADIIMRGQKQFFMPEVEND